MSQVGSRSRTMLVPLKKSGPVKLGYYLQAITSGGVPTGQFSPVETNPRYHTYLSLHHTSKITVDELHEGPPYYSGGPFHTLRATISHPYGGVVGNGIRLRNDKKEKYVGGFRTAEMSEFGTQAMFPSLSHVLNNSSSYYPPTTGMGDRVYSSIKPRVRLPEVSFSELSSETFLDN